jgi:hypothetical protein
VPPHHVALGQPRDEAVGTQSFEQLTLLDFKAGAYAFYGWQSTIIVLWPTQATGPAVDRFIMAAERFTRARPEGVSHIHIVANGAAMPTSEARTGFVHIYQHEGDGFWAATLRSAVTGIRMLCPRTFSMRCNENILEVALWLPKEHAKRTGVVLPPDALTQALRQARDY